MRGASERQEFIDGLSLIVEHSLGLDPFAEALHVLVNRCGDTPAARLVTVPSVQPVQKSLALSAWRPLDLSGHHGDDGQA